ncbi:thiopurine S-methyltransferase [Salinicola sp. DM10]|uniref:thiopurine S-methyltransferase n=1 Tax=Salinicola sp. DM10 TaxID=2815721 RepID=UPI001A8C9F84|nr:thiopurine S-methyltransferase [Salinicola sp. DM10]MCE3028924.1 thiopurine S-methyltransferase [Salinicola sp. DM10]
MQIDWLRRWREGRIGFHRDAPHAALVNHWRQLGLAPGAKVLVPLCGKSHDMRWLAAQAHPVLGVELSPLAVDQFIGEGALPALRYAQAGFSCVRQGRIELWCGDFFRFHVEQAAELAAFYDRAALIALPPATRQRYAHHLAQLFLPGTQGLLVTLTHADGEQGPPYSVDAAEVERLLGPNFALQRLDGPGEPDAKGTRETVWHLLRRGPCR